MSYRGNRKGNYGSFRKAQKFHARRSQNARMIDEGLRAPLAKSPQEWLQKPNRLDLPNIDMPKQCLDDKKMVEHQFKSPNNNERQQMFKMLGVFR